MSAHARTPDEDARIAVRRRRRALRRLLHRGM